MGNWNQQEHTAHIRTAKRNEWRLNTVNAGNRVNRRIPLTNTWQKGENLVDGGHRWRSVRFKTDSKWYLLDRLRRSPRSHVGIRAAGYNCLCKLFIGDQSHAVELIELASRQLGEIVVIDLGERIAVFEMPL